MLAERGGRNLAPPGIEVRDHHVGRRRHATRARWPRPAGGTAGDDEGIACEFHCSPTPPLRRSRSPPRLAAVGAGRGHAVLQPGGARRAPRWVRRMPEGPAGGRWRCRAAMHVRPCRVRGRGRESRSSEVLRTEGLVDLGDRRPRPRAGPPCGGADRRRRADAHDLRRHRRRRAADHPGQRLRPVARTRSPRATSTAAAPSTMAELLPPVCTPRRRA